MSVIGNLDRNSASSIIGNWDLNSSSVIRILILCECYQEFGPEFYIESNVIKNLNLNSA